MTETIASFSQVVQARSGEPVQACYYCQKCTAGCPTALVMDYTPAQVLRLIQLDRKQELLQSNTAWMCVGCEACGTRCPNDIRLAPVMDVLKEMSLEEGFSPDKRVYALHKSFLDSIRIFGRVHEISMLVEYKLRSMDLFSNLDLGILLVLKGKVLNLPHRVKALEEVKALYKRAGIG